MKKGQIKFGETFGVIFIVYIVLVLGMIWYNGVESKELASMNKDFQEERAFEKYYYVVNSPFLHKSEAGDVDEEFDLTSIKVFANFSQTGDGKEFVRKDLGESLIILELKNKSFASFENITIYNNTPKYNNGKIIQQEVFKTLIPVEDSISDKIYIGVLNVIIFS